VGTVRDKPLSEARSEAQLYLSWKMNYARASLSKGALQRHAKSVFSQNGEDGMIEEALRRLGIDSPSFVEIGASDGSENCTHNLLLNGASGLWVEGDVDLVDRARNSFSDFPVDVRNKFVTTGNIIEIIRSSSRVCNGFDVLVMDTDGNDWWLLQKILTEYQPSLIVAEYNAATGPRTEWIMEYNSEHSWKQDRLYGASLTSYDKLMRHFGYRLVACDPAGVNAFWVTRSKRRLFTRHSKPQFHFAPMPPEALHPEIGTAHMEVTLSKHELSCIEVTSVERIFYNGESALIVEVFNSTSTSLSSIGNSPVRIGIKKAVDDSAEPKRARFSNAVCPGTYGTAYFNIENDVRSAWIAPVQEGKQWGEWQLFSF